MAKVRTSFISTVLNEEENIKDFIISILNQTQLPDEIIIVDGGSKDKTIEKISKFKKIILIRKRGNRSVGRNEAIRKAKGKIILSSDAGCILDKNWVRNITKPFENPSIDVVAGFYSAFAKSIFEKCLIPYVLVMPDKLDSRNFLPSARSMAFKKIVWEKAGKFPENYSHNEDFVFSRNLKKGNFKITFQKNAKVYWLPRKNIFQAALMFFKFSLGDAESKILRPKVIFLLLRYVVGISLLLIYLLTHSSFILNLICFILITYIIWSIYKNFNYVKKWQAVFILPLIQFVSDASVISGTIWGTLKRQ